MLTFSWFFFLGGGAVNKGFFNNVVYENPELNVQGQHVSARQRWCIVREIRLKRNYIQCAKEETVIGTCLCNCPRLRVT